MRNTGSTKPNIKIVRKNQNPEKSLDEITILQKLSNKVRWKTGFMYITEMGRGFMKPESKPSGITNKNVQEVSKRCEQLKKKERKNNR